MTEIEKLTQMINAIYGSRYLKDLKTAATNKRKDILLIQETLNAWIKFQKHYIYLESIFSQNEIKKPLQMEAKEFEESVNKHYKSNVKKVVANQSMTQIIKQKILDLLYNSFQKQNHTLSELNKKINNFLDSKREFFPRFYFIPNEELIYILANYDNPVAFQTFIGKLFQNVNK
jgi:dynein heavy chain